MKIVALKQVKRMVNPSRKPQQVSALQSKDARKESNRQYYLQNKNRLNELQRLYHTENRDKIRLSKRQYYLQNLRHLHESQQKYYLQHKDSGSVSTSRYYVQNKEKVNEAHLHYRFLNKDKFQQLNRQYSTQNSDKVNEVQQHYLLKNSDKMQDYHRQYYLENKDLLYDNSNYSQNKDKRNDYLQHYRFQNKDKITESKRQYYLQSHENPDAYLPRLKPLKSWRTPEIARENLQSIANQLSLSSYAEWYRTSHDQLRCIGGGSILPKFETLGVALQYAYPEINWNLSKFSEKGKKSGQRWLKVMIDELLPGVEIIENYQHPELSWDTTGDRHVELDLWIPQYHIGIEYQGEQHYFNLDSAFGPNGTSSLYSERDSVKHTMCQVRGITLISIPFWYYFVENLGVSDWCANCIRWDGERESLSSMLSQIRPDVFSKQMLA